jgi:CSLREA domain-containing protein
MRSAVFALALLLASPAPAAIFIVDVTEDGIDAVPGDADCDDGAGNCSLRGAIQEANALAGPDVVVLTDGVYALTLKRDTDRPDDETGDLDVTDEITVVGDGAAASCDGVNCTAIDAKKAKDRAFDVHPGGDLELQDVSVRNGKAAKDDFNDSQLEEVTGGCIRVEGDLHLDEVTVERCKSPDDGGCIGLTDASTGDLVDSFLDRCKTKDSGGGIEADLATVSMDRVTIANSKSAEGGGIEATGGTLALRNLTLSRNKAKLGGGLFIESDANVLINNATFFDNKSKEGASIDALSNTTPVALANSLLRAGGKELNCLGPITSAGGNLENGLTCPLTQPTDCSDCDPSIVSDLLDNGGAVPTHAIDLDSEAIDNGVALSCEPTDAREAGRNGTCDSGAFEFNGVF